MLVYGTAELTLPSRRCQMGDWIKSAIKAKYNIRSLLARLRVLIFAEERPWGAVVGVPPDVARTISMGTDNDCRRPAGNSFGVTECRPR
jgi:hypothetical protein